MSATRAVSQSVVPQPMSPSVSVAIVQSGQLTARGSSEQLALGEEFQRTIDRLRTDNATCQQRLEVLLEAKKQRTGSNIVRDSENPAAEIERMRSQVSYIETAPAHFSTPRLRTRLSSGAADAVVSVEETRRWATPARGAANLPMQAENNSRGVSHAGKLPAPTVVADVDASEGSLALAPEDAGEVLSQLRRDLAVSQAQMSMVVGALADLRRDFGSVQERMLEQVDGQQLLEDLRHLRHQLLEDMRKEMQDELNCFRESVEQQASKDAADSAAAKGLEEANSFSLAKATYDDSAHAEDMQELRAEIAALKASTQEECQRTLGLALEPRVQALEKSSQQLDVMDIAARFEAVDASVEAFDANQASRDNNLQRLEASMQHVIQAISPFSVRLENVETQLQCFGKEVDELRGEHGLAISNLGSSLGGLWAQVDSMKASAHSTMLPAEPETPRRDESDQCHAAVIPAAQGAPPPPWARRGRSRPPANPRPSPEARHTPASFAEECQAYQQPLPLLTPPAQDVAGTLRKLVQQVNRSVSDVVNSGADDRLAFVATMASPAPTAAQLHHAEEFEPVLFPFEPPSQAANLQPPAVIEHSTLDSKAAREDLVRALQAVQQLQERSGMSKTGSGQVPLIVAGAD